MDNKPVWESKTFWFNLILLVVAVASKFGFSDYVPTPAHQMLIDSSAVILAALINIGLRFVTSQGVTLTRD